MALILTPVTNIPDIKPGDHLSSLLIDCLRKQGISLNNNDILVVTQKIVSKAENRFINLSTITPTDEALEIAKTSNKNPQLIELILRESKKVIRVNRRTIITEHKLGFISANAGIDHSNVRGESGEQDDWYLLLPKDPDYSAKQMRLYINSTEDVNIGVMIIDSHGRAWRYGTVGTMIGTAGVPGLVDLRGKKDLYGYKLKITRVAAADELASAASLIMGQANENIPVVHVRGFPYPLRNACLNEVLRPEKKDLFR